MKQQQQYYYKQKANFMEIMHWFFVLENLLQLYERYKKDALSSVRLPPRNALTKKRITGNFWTSVRQLVNVEFLWMFNGKFSDKDLCSLGKN